MNTFEQIYHKYNQQLYRLAFLYVKNEADALDIVQTTFISFLKQKEFASDEHIKRWLLRPCINQSKNHLKSFWHRNVTTFDENTNITNEETIVLLEQVLLLPKQYKAVLYLYYYEGYQVKEIAEILKISESSVKQN